jgi:hypothetical protein
LLQFVRFEFLSLEYSTKFFDLFRNSFNWFAVSHCESLRARLLLPVSAICTNNWTTALDLTISSTSPLQEIITHFPAKYDGNFHDRDIVYDTWGSGDWAVKTVADLVDNSVFQSEISPDHWICYDFKDLIIRPTHYSLLSGYGQGSSFGLNDWVIDGSNDGKSGAEFDRREHNSELDAWNAMKMFQRSRSDEVRMIRLRQLRKREMNQCLALSGFEVFGSLVMCPGSQSEANRNLCKKSEWQSSLVWPPSTNGVVPPLASMLLDTRIHRTRSNGRRPS